MVQLFEQDIKTNDRQSSKGNQLKWCRNNVWYKADYMGYEGNRKSMFYIKQKRLVIREENIWDVKVKIFCLRDGSLLH